MHVWARNLARRGAWNPVLCARIYHPEGERKKASFSHVEKLARYEHDKLLCCQVLSVNLNYYYYDDLPWCLVDEILRSQLV
jgi:hypothetical protein